MKSVTSGRAGGLKLGNRSKRLGNESVAATLHAIHCAHAALLRQFGFATPCPLTPGLVGASGVYPSEAFYLTDRWKEHRNTPGIVKLCESPGRAGGLLIIIIIKIISSERTLLVLLIRYRFIGEYIRVCFFGG